MDDGLWTSPENAFTTKDATRPQAATKGGGEEGTNRQDAKNAKGEGEEMNRQAAKESGTALGLRPVAATRKLFTRRKFCQLVVRSTRRR